jgi:hypothetical protein
MAIRRTMLLTTKNDRIKRIPWDYVKIDGIDALCISPMPVPAMLDKDNQIQVDLLFDPLAQPDYEIDEIQYFDSENEFIALHENCIGQYVTDSSQSREFGFPCDRYGARV